MSPTRRRTSAPLALSTAVLLAACNSDPSGPGVGPQRAPTQARAAAAQPRHVRTINDEFRELARSAPGFTGVYYDDQGNLTISVARDDFSAAARETVMAWLRAYSPYAAASLQAGAAPARLRRVAFDYAALDSAWRAIRPALGATPEVTGTYIDEAEGRVVIDVESLNAEPRLRGLLAGLRLPAGMLVVKQSPRLVAAGLQDKIRPMGYGVQISRRNPGEFGECSTGFHVYQKNASGYIDPGLGYFFLTASHCSIERGVVDGSVWGQPYISDTVGTEVADAYRFNTGPDCNYGGVYCQWADVTVMQLRPDVAITTAAAKSTSVLPPTNPPFNGWQGTFSSTPMYGGAILNQPVMKTGRSTGQTSGKVTKTCYSAPYGGYYTLCMQEADMRIRPGDSGAAVWVPYSSSQSSFTPHPHGIVVAWNQQTGSGDRSYLSPIGRALSEVGGQYDFY